MSIFPTMTPSKLALLPFVTLLSLVVPLVAGEETALDFEGGSLAGFGAVYQESGGKEHYQAAAKWSAPFRVSTVADNPHAGTQCLLWEFIEPANGTSSLRFPVIKLPDGATKFTVRFFIRTENLDTGGLLSIGEMGADGKHLKTDYGVVPVPAGSEWREIVWQGTLGPEASGVRVTLDFKSVLSPAKVWLDDLSVVPNPAVQP